MIVALLVLGAPFVGAVINTLSQTAHRTGIRENTPRQVAQNYTPAPIPYVSVQPLMQYSGSDVPVVPQAAVVDRNGQMVVFVVMGINYDGQYADLTVHTQPVQVGKNYGKAEGITVGLTPCDRVVVNPPASLNDGDHIQSYALENSDSPAIDYSNLFGDLPPAPQASIEGGIAHQNGANVVLYFLYHGDAPEGVTYLFRAPDGSEQTGKYQSSGVEVTIPDELLQPNEPVGHVELLNSSNAPIAQGDLAWFCGP